MHYVWLKLIIWLSTSYQNALFMCWVLTLCWNNVLWLVKTLPTFFNIQSALYLRRVIYLLRNSYMSLAQTLLGSPHSTYKGCIASCSSTIKMTRSVQIESKIFKADILRRFPHSKADGQNHWNEQKSWALTCRLLGKDVGWWNPAHVPVRICRVSRGWCCVPRSARRGVGWRSIVNVVPWGWKINNKGLFNLTQSVNQSH